MIVTTILRGSLVCLQCGREAGKAEESDAGLVPTAKRPEHAEAVSQFRCPSCIGGQLWTEHLVRVPVWDEPTAEEWAQPVRRGRPPKARMR